MERVREKLRSQRGASILLALLLFLVCVMAGASVLAAASSNAGKVRSNRTEQQRYLNLTSAIQLAADEIRRASYTGKYTVWEWEEKKTDKTTTTDNSVTPPQTSTSVTVTRTSYFYCMQTEGQYGCGDLTVQLPFLPKLETIFGKQFRDKGGKDAGFEPLYDPAAPPPAGRYDLLVTLEGLPDDAPAGYEVPMKTTVRVELDGNTHHILLTAWEGESVPMNGTAPDLSEAVQAELVAREGTVLDYSPGPRKVGTLADDGSGGKTFPAPKAAETSGNTTTTYEIINKTKTPYPDPAASPPQEPMRWELHWIRKGGTAP